MQTLVKTGLALVLGTLLLSTSYAQEDLNSVPSDATQAQSQQVAPTEPKSNSNYQPEQKVEQAESVKEINRQIKKYIKDLNIPCPPFWSVLPNPSVENSLSYIHDSGDLAVNVTYIESKSGVNVTSESFAKVATELMGCSFPVKSNILDKAWSFTCENGIEAIVYGEVGNIVLLSISGRNEKTEKSLYDFMLFLRYQASRN